MATLRNSIGIATDSGLAARLQDQDVANGMGSLRRGWETGRISNELNPLRTEALDAELAGNQPLAQSLRGQIDHLQQRQGMYAPAVGRVEDIHGVGDGLDWAAGQLGQGAASMVDPVAVSAGLSTAGRVAGAIPHPLARGAGWALQGAAMGLPAYMSKRQLTGEFIGEAERDPALMARTSPQSLRDMAGDYGTLAAIPDSFLPGMVGRQVSGLSRAGSQAARQATLGAGTKTLLGMGMEGGTEALQSAGSQYARGLLNPERDTSGDFMENVNSFAGGAVGAGPFAAAGAYSEAGHNRVDGGVDAVKDATGSVVDLMNSSPTVQAGKQAFGKAKGSVIDLMAGDNAKDAATALVEKLKAATVDLGSRTGNALNERNILNEIPPDDIAADDTKIVEWLGQNRAARHQLVVDKLAAMPEDDAEAQQHLNAVVAQYPDAEAQDQAVSAAARFVLDRTPLGRAEERANSLGENLGKIAGVVGPAIGKGAVATGKAALNFGKAVLGGAQESMRKKNAQAEPEQESFSTWRDRWYSVTGKRLEGNYVDDPVGIQRADLAGNYVADMAGRLNKKQPNMALLARRAAFTLADTVMRVNAKGIGQKSVQLNRLVDDLYGAFRAETPEVLAQLGAIMGPKAAPVFEYLTNEAAARNTPGAARAQAAARDALATQTVALVDPGAQNQLLAQGINLNTPRGREQLLELMEDFADGIGTESGTHMRKALENTFGADSVKNILELLNGAAEEQGQTEVGSVVDDRTKTGEEPLDPNADDEGSETSAYEQRAAEKLVVKGVGTKVYGFHATVNPRSQDEGHDIFAPTEKSKPGEDGVVKRPSLFKKGQQLFGGKGDAIEKKIADIEQQLMEDPAYPDHDNYRVEARSAHDVMKDAGMQPGKVLQLYRDYMHMEYNDEKNPPEQKRYFAQQMRLANNMIKDGQYGSLGRNGPATEEQLKGSGIRVKKEAFKTTPQEREELSAAAEKYFKDRFVVVGEQLSNRDPSKITLPEVLAMHKKGQGLIERSRLAEDRAAALSDANILMFKSEAGGGKEIAIPAGELVKWVKQARGKSTVADAEDTGGSFSNKSKDEAYLADVMEGVAALIGSGRVKGMPYKINQFGEAENFTQGVPDSLRLVSKSYGAMKLGEQTRRENAEPVSNDKFQGADQEAVAADQERNAEFFTAESRTEIDPVTDQRTLKTTRRHVLSEGERDAFKALKGAPAREAFIAGLKEAHGEEWAAEFDAVGPFGAEFAGKPAAVDQTLRYRHKNAEGAPVGSVATPMGDRSSQFTAEPKTDKDNKTPLDFFPKPKDGVPDEYTNQRWLSRQTDASTDAVQGPEPKGTAASRADYRAEAITAAFLNDPAKGQEMVRMRIRSAMRPEYSEDKNAVVGGVHYIAPVAAFVSAKNLAKNNVDLEAKTIQAIQAKVANILLKGQVSDTERIKITRLLVAGTGEKISAFNVKPVLQRLAGGAVAQGAPVQAKPQSALAQAVMQGMDALYDAMSPTAEERIAKGNFDGLGTVAAVDKFLKDAYAVWGNGSDDRAVQTELNRMFGEGNFASTDLASFYGGLKGGNAELDHASLLKNLKSAPEVAKAGLPKGVVTPSGARNAQDARTGTGHVSTQAERDAATAYATKVLGPKIKVEFKDITGYSGEFIDAQNAIEISTTAAAGTLGTLYHEAMHVFFRDFVKGNPKLQVVFESLVDDPKHLAKLHALLDKYPAAQAQLVSGEERLAYTYQFWKAGLLEVDTKAHTWLQKVGKFFRRVAGMVRDSERALELFQAFDNGKMSEPSAAGMVIAEALAKGTGGLKMRRKMDALFQGLAALTFPSAEILGNSVSPTARKLGTMFFTNPGEEAHGKEEIGLMNARRSVAQQYINTSNRRFETMSDADQAAVQKYLQSEAELTDIPYSEHRAAVKDVRDLLDRFHKYMTDSGMKIGKVEKYYPTVWSTRALLSKKQAFTDMLVSKYAKELAPLNGDIAEAADRVWQSLVNKEGVDAHLPTNRDDGVLTPFFASQEMRTLPWLKGEDKEAYLEKDMPLTLTRYFSQGAHATEYFRRFGENGKRLEIMLAAINVELSGAAKEMLRRGEFKDEKARVEWVGRQMRDVTQATGAMEGSLGKDVSPNMRKFNSWMAVYQNIRLLPMALFSSFVDPLSMVARGAPLQAAYETFVYSMREVFRGWADVFKDMPPQRQKDEWRKLAEAIGASEIAMFSNLVSDQYSSTYMTPGAKRINDKMFVFNGMEAWNRGNRIMATKWAVRFIEQHAALPDRHHSARWLHEIGLTPAMITKNAEGNLITNRHELATAKGISLDEATKEIAHIHNALNRWVEGAVLTPNAAQRPSWSSDPSYASMFHLKQFSYSFHQTILKRATNEFKHGNMAPLGALALFVPTMIGADIMKGLIQGAGTLPPYMASMNAGDWVAHGVQRAGLSGIGVIGMDAATDWASLGGPAFEQLVDAARDGFGSSTALKAAPLHAVYGELVR